MKASLKSLATKAQPEAAPAPTAETVKSYITAKTRSDTRQLSGHFPSGDVQAFRVLAAENDMDVQELLAEALNMTFERYGRPNRIPVTSGRRKRSA